IEQGHAFLHQTLRPRQTDATLVCQKFPDCPNPTATEMVDVVERSRPASQVDQILNGGNEIPVGQNPFAQIDINTHLLIEFVPTHPAEIIFLRIKKEPLQ